LVGSGVGVAAGVQLEIRRVSTTSTPSAVHSFRLIAGFSFF
jgi:hypothetical protein